MTSTSDRPDSPWISLGDAAIELGVSIDTLKRRISCGSLPAYRNGQRIIRLRVSDIERFLRMQSPHEGDC